MAKVCGPWDWDTVLFGNWHLNRVGVNFEGYTSENILNRVGVPPNFEVRNHHF